MKLFQNINKVINIIYKVTYILILG